MAENSELNSNDDVYINAFIKLTSSGSNNNDIRQISDYVGSTRTVTVSNGFTTTPNLAVDSYQLFVMNLTTGIKIHL